MIVTVCWSPQPRVVHERALDLPSGSTVAHAIEAAGLHVELGGTEGSHGEREVGIWGRAATLNQALRESDRIELYRPLTVDPKVARRERFRKQGARGTGLFASRRPGAKSGY